MNVEISEEVQIIRKLVDREENNNRTDTRI
jgi:hypothetical protein